MDLTVNQKHLAYQEYIKSVCSLAYELSDNITTEQKQRYEYRRNMALAVMVAGKSAKKHIKEVDEIFIKLQSASLDNLSFLIVLHNKIFELADSLSKDLV